MWRHNSKAILVITFLLGMGSWVLSVGWRCVQEDQRLAQSSAETEGRVISGASRALSKGGQSLTVLVEYVPAGHAAITREFDVDSGDFRSAKATGKVTVTYVPDEPQISRVTKFAVLPYQFLIGLGGGMLLAGLFCLWHWLKNRAHR